MAKGKSLSRYLIGKAKPLLGYRGWLVLCLIAIFGLAVLPLRKVKTQDNSEGELLVVEAVSSASLAAGEARSYLLAAKADQHVRLEISKGDLALKATLCREAGDMCLEFTKRDYGTLDVSFTAPIAGHYRFQVSSLERDAVKRHFELRVVEIVTANERYRSIDGATGFLAEAESLKERQDLSSRLAAISKYYEAQRLWEAAGLREKAAEALCNSGDVYFSLSRYQEALSRYQQSLMVAKPDDLIYLRALNGIGYMYAWLGENDQAFGNAERVLKLVERLAAGSSQTRTRIKAQAINTIGEVQYARRKLPESIESFERSLPLWKQAEARDGEALGLLNIGYSHADLGDLRKAAEYYELSLGVFRSINDGRGVAFAETALGGARSILGETQKALDAHNHAIEYFRQTGNKQGEAVALNGIATAYEDLNEYQAAIDNYLSALNIYKELGNRRLIALNKFVVGRALFRIGEQEKAEQSFLESLKLSRSIDDQVIEAGVLQSLAAVYFAHGKTKRALSQIETALTIYRRLGNHRSEAYALNDRGRFLVSSGDANSALMSFQQALPIMHSIGDQHGEALILINLAKFERDRGNLSVAQALLEDSLSITEAQHRKIRNSQLQTSYFASVQEQYEVYIDVLMRLHRKSPEKGYAALALVANERSRARSLVTSLLEGKIAKNDTSPGLASKELELLQALDERAGRQMQLLSRPHTAEEAQRLSEEIRALTIEYHDVRSQLKQQDPRHAILTETTQLRIEDLQKIIADDETLLLEFSLGEDVSYLWSVSRTGITSHELPGRSTIETMVRSVYDLVTVRQSRDELSNTNVEQADSEYWQQAALLSTMLLSGVASELGSKRLLVVADGALQYIPFDALPGPGLTPEQASREQEPLFLKHEIISIPSALTLAALGMKNNQNDSGKTIAVLADPVFERNDPRVSKTLVNAVQAGENGDLSRALRSFAASDASQKLTRLPATMREANAIRVAIGGECVVTTGLEATREYVLTGGVKDYRVVHFATHGLLNSEHPELSGLILSILDEHGNDRNGFLRVNDIYNLNLSADLVVLSACRTGLGKDIRGEGIVGLPSAFMYAGAKSTIASLWKVNDEATAELMSHFYPRVFNEGLPPAAALRKAKEEMWRQERWHAPFYWAAFVFQGQYSHQVYRPYRGKTSQAAILGGILILSLGSAHAIRIIKRQRRAREKY
jgi:CHAT domain-containing protein